MLPPNITAREYLNYLHETVKNARTLGERMDLQHERAQLTACLQYLEKCYHKS